MWYPFYQLKIIYAPENVIDLSTDQKYITQYLTTDLKEIIELVV